VAEQKQRASGTLQRISVRLALEQETQEFIWRITYIPIYIRSKHMMNVQTVDLYCWVELKKGKILRDILSVD